MKLIIGSNSTCEGRRIESIIATIDANATVLGVFQRKTEVTPLVKEGLNIDLLLLDTDLADGKGFEILEGRFGEVPVIFYSHSLDDVLRAFRHNVIDYVLKPVTTSRVKEAVEKFVKHANRWWHPPQEPRIPENIPRQRIIIRSGNKIQFRHVRDVAVLYAEGKLVYMVPRNENRKYLIDHTLEELEGSLPAETFFRISRKHIVSIDSIAEVRGVVSGKLDIRLLQACDQELRVSRDRARSFRQWLDR